MADTGKKKKIDMKALKADGIDTALMMGGFMAAHAAQMIPIENQLVRNVIPLGVGAGLLIGGQMIPKGGNLLRSAGKGMVVYGAMAAIRTLLTSDAMPGGNEEGQTEGVMGIGENETMRKVVDALFPNFNGGVNGLGMVELDYNDAYNPDFEAHMVEDIDMTDVTDLSGFDDLNDPFALNGDFDLEEDPFAMVA
ncbi:MAG: hypothetical protein ACI8ZM_002477 [Crocinitomix sp.]|jgi:hypothetical protein